MKSFVFAAAALATSWAMFASPVAAGHLYSDAQPPYGLQEYGAQWHSGYPPAPDARAFAPRGLYYGRDGRRSRTGLDRPYGGHGVPYRTPPQGWPDRTN